MIALGGIIGFGVQFYDPSLLPIVGDLPFGFPIPRLPMGSVEEVVRLIPTTLIVAGIGFLESMAISNKYGEKYGYEVNANRELMALGLMNVLVGVFGGYPTTGSFAKTVINDDVGGKTQMSSIVAGISVMICVGFLRELLGFVPRATLAAVILSAVVKLIEIDK